MKWINKQQPQLADNITQNDLKDNYSQIMRYMVTIEMYSTTSLLWKSEFSNTRQEVLYAV